jgi:sulfur carrier protein ThiS adenylyltransferase
LVNFANCHFNQAGFFLNQTNSLEMNKIEISDRLKTKKVGIAGCGGLGSNAAVALARIGLKKIVLIDFDVIDESNLNRQYYFRDQVGMLKVNALRENLLRIHSDILIEIHSVKLEPENVVSLLEGCDLVIEAFDGAESKEMLVETMMDQLHRIPLIVGNGMAGYGRFEILQINQWSKNVYVCGDGLSEIADDLPPLAPRVGIVANMQANLALELLLNQ